VDDLDLAEMTDAVFGELAEDGSRVVLVVPAGSEHLRTIRIVAADAAMRSGLNYDEVEDFRVAVDELSYVLMTATDHQLVVSFSVFDRRIVARGSARRRTARQSMELPELSATIVRALTDSCRFETGREEAWFMVMKESHRAPVVQP
jgi:hypothetical protein